MDNTEDSGHDSGQDHSPKYHIVDTSDRMKQIVLAAIYERYNGQ